jgi:hypothetical protein
VDKLFIFARTFEEAVNYVRLEKLLAWDYCIVRDYSSTFGVKIEPDQVVVIGEYYKNPEVSLAYDIAVDQMKTRMQYAANNRR